MGEILTEKEKKFGTQIVLISDEPYRELAYDGAEVPYVTKFYHNTVICYSYSKSLSLPGERIGYLVIPDELTDSKEVFNAAVIANRVMGAVNAPSLMQRVVMRCVDETADISMAADIIENAKTQRMGVCNACESLVIHSGMLEKALLPIVKKLSEHGIEIRGDERVREICPEIKAASQDDWGTEYLDAIISVKTVDSIDEAISHINKYNTGHSESIITNDYNHALKFQDEIDAAAVYVNASTRFTDGFEFGFGAEIGISTQKLHARGPMGLEALTTTKYIIFGNGQIRK